MSKVAFKVIFADESYQINRGTVSETDKRPLAPGISTSLCRVETEALYGPERGMLIVTGEVRRRTETHGDWVVVSRHVDAMYCDGSEAVRKAVIFHDVYRGQEFSFEEMVK